MSSLVKNENDRVGKWVCERSGGRYIPGMGHAIGLEKDGELIAGVFIENYTGTSCMLHVAGIGRRWLTKEFLFTVFWYVFTQLGCKVALAPVPATNEDALRFDRHLGFTELARIPDAFPSGDGILLIMKKEDCRWLTINSEN